MKLTHTIIVGITLWLLSTTAGNPATLSVSGASTAFPETSTHFLAETKLPQRLLIELPVDDRAQHFGEKVAGTTWKACETAAAWAKDAAPFLIQMRLVRAFHSSAMFEHISTNQVRPGDIVLKTHIQAFCSQVDGSLHDRVGGMTSLHVTLERDGKVLLDKQFEKEVTDADREHTGSEATFTEQAMGVTAAKSLSAVMEEILQQCGAAVQPIVAEYLAAIDKRVQFLQANFAKFVPVEFKKDAGSNAAIQLLHVSENIFEHEGTNYCGFKFTVPEWLDGDLEWMYLLAKVESNRNFTTHGLTWYIVPETGRSKGFEYFETDGFSDYPRLKAQFPYTGVLTIQSLDMTRLTPGKTYAIWFAFRDQNMPDIAFAMTIDSARGAKEFGNLPLQ